MPSAASEGKNCAGVTCPVQLVRAETVQESHTQCIPSEGRNCADTGDSC